MTGTFDSDCQCSLTFSAVTGFLPRFNTSSIRYKPTDIRYVFVIDFGFFTKTLPPPPASTSKCWACTLRCSWACHFLPRGTDSGTIGLTVQPRMETATRAVPPRLLLDYFHQVLENLILVMCKFELPLEHPQWYLSRLHLVNQEKQP